jgi:hypothetical protein
VPDEADERAEEGAEVGRLRMVSAGPGERAAGGGRRDVEDDADAVEEELRME